MERRTFVWNGLLFTASLGLGACQHEYREEPYGRRARYYGPPPHAPAHGYRHRYRRGVDLVFDSALGVYLVVGARRTYYHDGRFYRYRRGDWEVSRDYDGNWRNSSGRRLPRGLRRQARRWHRGPPPRAPRHGHRYHYRRGVDLVFDSGLGVYLVVGTPFYYYGDRFYRYHDGHWESRADHRGRWRPASGRDLPRALRRKHRRRKDDDDDRRRRRDRDRRDR